MENRTVRRGGPRLRIERLEERIAPGSISASASSSVNSSGQEPISSSASAVVAIGDDGNSAAVALNAVASPGMSVSSTGSLR